VKNNFPYVGLFLILGVGIGGVVYTVTKEAWHIGAGAGLGIALGAIVQSMVGRRRP